MISRAATSWLLLLALGLFAACAFDFAVFVWRQRHGDILSFTNVKQSIAVPDAHGGYHYEYFGNTDISCVQALLPHAGLAPCWWVQVHHDDWR